MATKLTKAHLLTKVLSANRQEVVMYLYEGAISYLHRAQDALDSNRRKQASQAIDRTISIIVELSGSLNFATGDHLAVRLSAIYNYLIETLALANNRHDAEALSACESILLTLHDAWIQATELSGKSSETVMVRLPMSA